MGDPVVVESWHVPWDLSGEALRLLTSLPMKEIERRLLAPIPAPIPVSERLPGPDDCDAEGNCWWFSFEELAWIFADLEYAKNRRHTYWLPAHALPLPEVDHD